MDKAFFKQPGNWFYKIIQNISTKKGVDGDPIDVRKQVPEIRYYEDVLSNAITMTCVITDTGGLDPEP